ncbi:MAG: DNA repair protein RadA [Patescibacteria group bacterium]|nr:DNA repair protein RadA [Patescibacteria group bacterium]
MKRRSVFLCQQCGHETPQWYGKCPSCGSWNTLIEYSYETKTQKNKAQQWNNDVQIAPQKLSAVRHIQTHRLKTTIEEFDRVMGGGIVPGSATLLSGDPGIGKSTLLLLVLSKIGGVYIAGEESAEQVKLRASRIGVAGDTIDIYPDTNLERILATVSRMTQLSPFLVVVDSIQTISSDNLEGLSGTVGQIRYCAEQLIMFAKSRSVPIILIGHITKEGTIAGPKILEHMVDTVLFFEGERFSSARILRTLKNRFGAVEEIGIFDMRDNGLHEVSNPSSLFLSDRVVDVPGSVVTVVLEGTRPLLVEIQSLVVPTQLAIPRRVANGFDGNRLQLLCAILQKRLHLPLGGFDIFVNVSGGIRVSEPSVDLAVCVAIVSSFLNKPVESHTVVFGEVGLLGEVRHVSHEDRRIKEAERLGYNRVIRPSTIQTIQQIKNIVQ